MGMGGGGGGRKEGRKEEREEGGIQHTCLVLSRAEQSARVENILRQPNPPPTSWQTSNNPAPFPS